MELRYILLWTVIQLIVLGSNIVDGDIYFHNPRGSNNRLDEDGRARNNANRMFDSQNNDRGGYNVGSLYYYGTSVLQVEWTNQHSCGDTNSHCELVLQYMCGDHVRDGATTTTIPDSRMRCQNYNCDTDLRYGLHEDYGYYLMCKTRRRNTGLFTADQNLNNRNTARFTRQNAGGTRRGYECPEERDYYPYWHPSPWIDIAVMTDDVSRCAFYQRESQNVKGRWACVVSISSLEKSPNTIVPNTKEACETFEVNGVKGEWRRFEPHGVPPPDCRETEFTRDNHLGNGLGGHPNLYNWTVPNVDRDSCVLRIRYNVSTNDYDGWKTNASENANPRRRGDGSKVSLAEKYGFATDAAARARGYVFKTNPKVKVFGDADFTLQMAVNTAQYGRVFQDRSHTFAIRKRPEGSSSGTIHNLNVRGKRGNIVQVYPAVEYDFVPNTVEVTENDMVHIQWTGSNTNPRNNDGQGLAGTDRSNLVLLGPQQFPEGSGWSFGPGGKYGQYGINFPMHLTNVTFLGMDRKSLETLAFLDPGQFRGEMSELDDAGTYLNLGLRSVTSPAGIYYYMCTRNNNFSNRDQKGRVVVYPHPIAQAAIGAMGGNVSLSDGSLEVVVAPGAFEGLQKLQLQKWSTQQGEQKMKAQNREIQFGEEYASSFYVVSPEQELSGIDTPITTRISITTDDDIHVYRSNSQNFAAWTQVPDVKISDGKASFQVSQGGVFVARTKDTDVGMIIGVTIACIVIAAVCVGVVIYFRRHPSQWQAVATNCRNAGRSFQSKV